MNDLNRTPGHPADDDLSMVRHLLAEPPPPAPDVVASARTALNQAIQPRPGHIRRPHRSYRLVAAAAAVAVVAGGAAYGLSTGLGGSVATAPRHGSTARLAAVNGCAQDWVVRGIVEHVQRDRVVLKAPDHPPLTVTTSGQTHIVVGRRFPTDVSNGEYVNILGTISDDVITAHGIGVGLDERAGTSKPGRRLLFSGTVTDLGAHGFTVITSGGRRIRAVVPNRGAAVIVFRARPDMLSIGQPAVVFGRAGTRMALGIIQLPTISLSTAGSHRVQPHGCSTPAITTAYLTAAGAPGAP